MDAFLALVPLLVFVLWALLHLGRFRWRNRGRTDWGHDRGGSALLPASLRAWWLEEIAPMVDWLVRAGVRADHVTWLGTAFSFGAAAAFGLRAFVVGGYVLLVGGICDILDGHVARRSGQASLRGAFLDSSLDRYADMAVLIGLAVAFREGWVGLVALVALVGAVMTSYARARAEGLGLACRGGLMQRPERIVVIGFAAILDPALSAGLRAVAGTEGEVFLALAVTVMAVLVNGTAAARVRTTWLLLRERERAAAAAAAAAPPPGGGQPVRAADQAAAAPSPPATRG